MGDSQFLTQIANKAKLRKAAKRIELKRRNVHDAIGGCLDKPPSAVNNLLEHEWDACPLGDDTTLLIGLAGIFDHWREIPHGENDPDCVIDEPSAIGIEPHSIMLLK
jgi:hypothetical protein